jgi:hypothetical protein
MKGKMTKEQIKELLKGFEKEREKFVTVMKAMPAEMLLLLRNKYVVSMKKRFKGSPVITLDAIATWCVPSITSLVPLSTDSRCSLVKVFVEYRKIRANVSDGNSSLQPRAITNPIIRSGIFKQLERLSVVRKSFVYVRDWLLVCRQVASTFDLVGHYAERNYYGRHVICINTR